MRGALAALLELEDDLEVVAEVGRGDEVVAAVASHGVDVALLDIEMPGIDGVAATAALRRRSCRCRVLIVTTFGRPGYLRRAMDAGASGSSSRTRRRRSSRTPCGGCTPGLRVVDPAPRGRLADPGRLAADQARRRRC